VKHLTAKQLLALEIPGMYKIFNPSLCKFNDNFVICCRYSNKVLKNFFMYMYSNFDYQSHICFIVTDKQFNIKNIVFPKLQSNFLEDPRICFYNNLFFVSVTEFINKRSIFPSLYMFDTEFNFIRKVEYNWDTYYMYRESDMGKKIRFPRNQIEKNWCPFVFKQKMFIHTDSYPTWNVFVLNTDGNLQLFLSYDTTLFFNSTNMKLIRCSTSWVDFTETTLLCGLHTKKFSLQKFLPTMRSIFVEIDKVTFKPVRKTNVLCFDIKHHRRIQFLSGMESDENSIYITLGLGDYKFTVTKIPKNRIEQLLF
jgi:hypothetical protein